jgi:hypothetical protein
MPVNGLVVEEFCDAKEATDVKAQDENSVDLLFFLIRDVIHFEFVPKGTAVN